MATGVKGGVFEYYGRQYRDVFARFHIELELRETAGAGENVKLLLDPNSDVEIALTVGGISDGKHAPGLLSLGTVFNQPFWLFYTSNEPLDRLSQVKGKRIAVGPVGSGTRLAADQILGKGGINSETAAGFCEVRAATAGSPAAAVRLRFDERTRARRTASSITGPDTHCPCREFLYRQRRSIASQL